MSLMTERPIAAGNKIVDEIDRVVVGVDDSDAGLAAVASAVMLARTYGAQLVAIRAWALGLPRHGGRRLRHLRHPHVILSFSDVEQRDACTVLIGKVFNEAIGRFPRDIIVSIETRDSDPAVALVTIASEPGDVIVVGTDGGHLIRRLIHGSVGRYCVKYARCPVTRVHGPPRQLSESGHTVRRTIASHGSPSQSA